MAKHLSASRFRNFPIWVVLLGVQGGVALGQGYSEKLFEQLEYRHIGPVGNRVSAVTGVAGDFNIYYIGAASGGIFKTQDGGASWEPVFDEQPAQSIGALAVAASDSNVVWAGTGEAHIRSNVSIGNGVYKSTDGGKRWTHMGLEKTGRISRIVIHPSDPDTVLVAALGHCYGPQEERGVFRTTDGGQNWERVLFTGPEAGASDLVMDPNNPRILFAGTWQMVIWTWGRQSGGPGSGLYRSSDGGSTWKRLSGHGLPKPPWGKVALSMSAKDSRRVYALIETNSNEDFAELEQHQGVLWRSDDGGSSWTLANSDHTLAQRPHYYSRVVAAPDAADRVYFLSTRASISRDGGETYENFPVAGDHHDLWIDPLIPTRMIVGHDQGISISTTGGESWLRPQLPIAQMYHVFTDDQVPYGVYGNRQDGSSMGGPSNTLTSGEIPIGAWHSVGGCESGFAIPDPADPNIVWSGCYEGILDRYDARTGHSRSVNVWPDNAEAWPGKDLRYRFQWTFPIHISPHDGNRVYVGSQYVHLTTDGGQSWRIISPDLSTNDKSIQQRFGGLTPDDAGPTIAATLFAIAESPLEKGVIWAGTNDGLLHITRDGGENWVNVTAGLPGLPPRGTVSNIEPSRHQPGKAYVTFDLHQVNDTHPYVFKTVDYGKSWQAIGGGVPYSVFSYAHCVREDPRRPGLLYLGTENALYMSFDDGHNWEPLQNNLPHAPVHWLTVQAGFNDLVVATYGRGFWILDDITPLQQFDEGLLESDAHLFAPRPAYRFRMREPHMRQPGDPVAGTNPQYGASIHFYLRNGLQEDAKLSILDAEGNLVRELKLKDQEGSGESEAESGESSEEAASQETEAGESGDVSPEPPSPASIRRVFWDLRYEQTPQPKLRAKPRQHAHVSLGEKGWRPLQEGGRFAPLVPPGVYTLSLKAGEVERTARLEVLKDPNSAGTLDDIRVQHGVVKELYDSVIAAVALIDEAEDLRRQLLDLEERLKKIEAPPEALERLRQLEDSLATLEDEFFDLRLTNARQDTLWWGRKLYSKMLILARQIQQSDFPPTDQQMEVYRLYEEEFSRHRESMRRIREEQVSAFNDFLRQANIGTIVTNAP